MTGGGDNGRGAADYVGVGDGTAASCSSSHTGNLNCGTGATVTPNAGSNFLIYWDDDEWRELENGTSITKASGGDPAELLRVRVEQQHEVDSDVDR